MGFRPREGCGMHRGFIEPGVYTIVLPSPRGVWDASENVHNAESRVGEVMHSFHKKYNT